MYRFPSILLALLVLFCIVAQCASVEVENDGELNENIRIKRSYYGGYDMYGDDYWYAGRIIGIIIGVCLLLFCCCLPCVCIAGIWFAGWFGLRNRRQQKNAGQAGSVPVAVQSIPPPPQPVYYPTHNPIPINQSYNNVPGDANYRPARQIHVESSPRDSESSRVMVPGDQVVFTAEDRYYTSSTAPVQPHRPDTYTTSRY